MPRIPGTKETRLNLEMSQETRISEEEDEFR